MSVKFFQIVLVFTAVILLSSCGSEDVTAPTGTVSFSRDIQPVFIQNCTYQGCHNSADRKAGIDATNWHSLVVEGSHFGSEIVPFNAEWSHLVWHINRDTNVTLVSEPLMPPVDPPHTNGIPLSKGAVALIMQWINEGARNDDGTVAYTNIPNKAFVLNQAADLIAVVNLDNYHVTRFINTGGRDNKTNPLDAPHVIVTDKAGKYFYVSLIAEGFIEKFDAFSYDKVGRMPANPSPAHIVITDDGKTGFFSNFTSQKLLKKFDTESMSVTDTLTTNTLSSPHGLRLTHDNNFLVTASQASEYIFKIRTSDFEIEFSGPVDETVPPSGNGTSQFKPYQVAITNDDRYAMVSLLQRNEVRIFDLNNYLLPHATLPVGIYPAGIEISPDGRWCYVPNINSNSVTVIEITNNSFQIVKTIPNVGVQPHMVDFTADSRYALVSCESRTGSIIHHTTIGSRIPGTTAVIDVKNGHVKIKDIEMASFPTGISITP